MTTLKLLEKIPIYQILIILLVLPIIYHIRNHFEIIQTLKTFLPNNLNSISHNNYFIAAWLSIVFLHWISLILVYIFLKINNEDFADIGYVLNLKQTLILITCLALIGIAIYLIKTHTSIRIPRFTLLHSNGEYAFWIFNSINSGFCEEIVFRGFGINSLKTWRISRLACYILPLISWISIHSMDSINSAIFTIIGIGAFGAICTLLYIWRKELTYSIALHSFADLFIILY